MENALDTGVSHALPNRDGGEEVVRVESFAERHDGDLIVRTE